MVGTGFLVAEGGGSDGVAEGGLDEVLHVGLGGEGEGGIGSETDEDVVGVDAE